MLPAAFISTTVATIAAVERNGRIQVIADTIAPMADHALDNFVHATYGRGYVKG